MGKVYVVQEVFHRDKATGMMKKLNMISAMDFGSLEVLLPSAEQTNVLNAAQITRTLRQKLASYGDDDYILAAGDPAAIGIACAIAAKVNHGFFTVLKWDKQETRYYPTPVNLNAEGV